MRRRVLVVAVAEPADDRVAARELGVAGAAAIVDRGVRNEQFGERVPVPSIERVAVAAEQLVDQDHVDGVEHGLHRRGLSEGTSCGSSAAGEARVNLK